MCVLSSFAIILGTCTIITVSVDFYIFINISIHGKAKNQTALRLPALDFLSGVVLIVVRAVARPGGSELDSHVPQDGGERVCVHPLLVGPSGRVKVGHGTVVHATVMISGGHVNQLSRCELRTGITANIAKIALGKDWLTISWRTHPA